MDLTTRCPQCGHTFPANLEQLQLRKGYIRCINCAHIFDGFEAVVSGPETEGAARPAPAAAPQAPAAATAPQAARVPPAPAAGSAASPAPSVVRQRRIVGGESAGPAFTISDRPAPGRDDPRFHVGAAPAQPDEPVISLDSGLEGAQESATHSVYVAREDVVRARPEPDTGAREPRFVGDAGQAAQAHSLYMEPREGERAAGGYDASHYQRVNAIGKWFWRMAVLLGLALLLAQLAYVYRVQIAASVPILRPVLEQACQPLGCQVPYSRNIGAISIMSSSLRSGTSLGLAAPAGEDKDAQAASSDKMVLQFILRNAYDRPQEWPTIVLSLKDASGSLVVRKNLPPDAYLPPEIAQGPFAAGSEVNARVPIMLNGHKVNGYQLDKFFE